MKASIQSISFLDEENLLGSGSVLGADLLPRAYISYAQPEQKKILLRHVHPSEQPSIHGEEISPRLYYEIKNAFDGQV